MSACIQHERPNPGAKMHSAGRAIERAGPVLTCAQAAVTDSLLARFVDDVQLLFASFNINDSF